MRNSAVAYARVVRVYRDLAARGNAEAQYKLGLMHENGQGITKNYLEASRWYEKAVAGGWVPAMVRLGILLANGQGVQKNMVRAYSLFLSADQAGHSSGEMLMEQIREKLSPEEIDQARNMVV